MTEQEARDDRGELSEFLFTIYDHGTSPNALREADAILAWMTERGYGKRPEPAWEYRVINPGEGYEGLECTYEAVLREANQVGDFIERRTIAVPAGPWTPIGEGTL